VNESEFPTIIGPDAKFKGELSFEKGVKVLGSFEGQINTKGTLVVASGAHMQADIEAGSIAVEGEVKGNMAASDLIELKQTATLQGDIRCARLVVIDGASFVGHCNVGNGAMDKAGLTKKAAPQAPVAPESR
jgi:cytoskeletal protein CcmA (bactofilin family)